MGLGWKKLNINGWVGHNGGADLKMKGEGGGVIHSKLVLVYTTKDTSLNFPLLTQCLKNTLNKCIQELARYNFFYISMFFFCINTYEWMKSFMVCFYFEFQVKKMFTLVRYWISLFYCFWIINTENITLQ